MECWSTQTYTTESASTGYEFTNCTELYQLNFSAPFLTSIGNHSFSGCTNLAKVDLPETLINISLYSFFNCASLQSLSIPSNVRLIGDYAFSNCSVLTDIIFCTRIVQPLTNKYWMKEERLSFVRKKTHRTLEDKNNSPPNISSIRLRNRNWRISILFMPVKD